MELESCFQSSNGSRKLIATCLQESKNSEIREIAIAPHFTKLMQSVEGMKDVMPWDKVVSKCFTLSSKPRDSSKLYQVDVDAAALGDNRSQSSVDRHLFSVATTAFKELASTVSDNGDELIETKAYFHQRNLDSSANMSARRYFDSASCMGQ